MADKRETILARIAAILNTISDIRTVVRNKGQIANVDRPSAHLLDADEISDEKDKGLGHNSKASNIVHMSPEIWVSLATASPNGEGSIGSNLNGLRAKIVKAIATDSTLLSTIGRNGVIRYDGCVTDLAKGRTLAGEMGLNFTFSYVLNPNDL